MEQVNKLFLNAIYVVACQECNFDGVQDKSYGSHGIVSYFRPSAIFNADAS
jgi:hypothetical protein